MEEIVGTVVGRWYVTLFGLTFFVCARRQLGWRKTLAFLGVATVVGAVAENASVRYGVPYTRYEFNENLRGDEIFVGDVPVMVPLSYSFMAYFAFAGGRMLAAGPYRTRAPRLWHEVVVAWMLAVWALWVLDPVARLGEHFYLGRLFEYEGPGFWFGLPTGSQVGFALTAGIMLAFLFRVDRDAPDEPVAGWRRHPGLIALVTYHGQVFHLAAVAFWIGRTGDVAEANTIAGAAILMWVPVAVVTAVHWSHLRLGRPPAAAATAPDGEAGQRDDRASSTAATISSV